MPPKSALCSGNMDAQRFLSAASAGDLATIKQIQAVVDSRVAYQVCNSDGNNALHVALLHGQWPTALYLMREMKVSQHKLNAAKESVFHSYARGLRAWGAPSRESLGEFREEQLQAWREEFAMIKAKEVTILHERPEAEAVPIETVESRDQDIFGSLELTLPKYFLESGHVYLYTQSGSGETCKDLAIALNLDTLAGYFEEEMKPAAAKRRLLRGLSEDLFREIVEFL